jgi:hypothetical protein
MNTPLFSITYSVDFAVKTNATQMLIKDAESRLIRRDQNSSSRREKAASETALSAYI